MAKLYWRLKRDGKWIWKPVDTGRFTQKEIIRDLVFYNKIKLEECEDEA